MKNGKLYKIVLMFAAGEKDHKTTALTAIETEPEYLQKHTARTERTDQ